MTANPYKATSGKVAAGLLCGTFIGFTAYFGAVWLSLSINATPASWLWVSVPIAIIACRMIAARAPSAGKAWRQMLISCGVAVLGLPVLAVAIWIIGIGQSSTQAEGTGAAIAGVFVLGAVAVPSLFVGGFLLIIGLLVGRDPQIVYVDRPVDKSP